MLTYSLKGITVLDFTQLAAGPICTMLMGDMGAEVIKVESPDGDLGRKLGPPWLNGESTVFLSANRNKRSIVIDLKNDEGKSLARRLAQRCDVVVESFRPGVAKRLGIGYEDIKEVNPDIVYCSISAFGQSGPWRDMAGVDGVIQAVSGLMSITGTESGGPSKSLVPAVDMVTGYLASIAVLGALRNRDRSGIGEWLDVNMYNCAIMFQQTSFSGYLASGQVPKRAGSAAPYAAPNEAFETQDGHLMVAAYQPERWKALCNVLGHPEWLDDPRFVDSPSRVKNRSDMVQELNSVFRTKISEEWQVILSNADIMCAPVASYRDLVNSPQLKNNGLLVNFEHPVAGVVTVPGFGISKTGELPRHPCPVPQKGQHSIQILLENGVNADEAADLLSRGVIA